MSRLIHCLSVAALAALTSTAYAQNVIDDHIKAAGGDALAKVKTITRVGKADLTGPFGAFQGAIEETYDVAGDRGHRLMDMVLFVRETAWTGDEGWQDGPPQGMRDLEGEELGVEKMFASPCMVASIKKQYGDAAFEAPAEGEFNGKACHHIKVKESPIEFYIDKETNLVAGIKAGERLSVTMEDYEEIEGVQFANKVTMEIQADQAIKIANQYEETEVNGEIDAELFEEPVFEDEESEEPAAAE